jgi:Alpha/beta hydrolase family
VTYILLHASRKYINILGGSFSISTGYSIRGVAHCQSTARRTCTADFAPQNGYLFLDRNKFAASFAADVEADAASFMADSQVPWGVDALQSAVTEPAWKTKPSYHLVASEDKMIPPPAQRAMAGRANAQVTEAPGSHAIDVSKPAEVAKLIQQAADARA